MACIMCSRKLWRQLGYTGRPRSEISEYRMPGVSLGPWAAKVFTDNGRELVLALDTRTYLTLLFPFAPVPQFQSNFAEALVNALRCAGVPPAITRVECAAVEFEPLVPLRSYQFTSTLNDVEIFCGIEFAYHDDLRTVQRNLNDIPYPHLDPCEPIAVVKRLFQSPAPVRTRCLN
jgi:hypothetical protein